MEHVPSFAGIGAFVVYHADFPITAGNKSSARRRVSGEPFAAVDVCPGSGSQHFRVEAQNVLGEPGPLSDELVIDTTSRLAYRYPSNGIPHPLSLGVRGRVDRRQAQVGDRHQQPTPPAEAAADSTACATSTVVSSWAAAPPRNASSSSSRRSASRRGSSDP